MEPGRQGDVMFARGMGVMMATFFGGVWLGLNLFAAKEFSWWVAAIFAVCFLGLYAGAVRLIRVGKKLRPQAAEQKPWPARKQFTWTVVTEILGIAAVILVCGWLGFYAFIELGIATIVGLHFVALAKIFQVPVYYVTAVAIVACCVASWIFLTSLKMDLIAGGATGVILWLTAAYNLVEAWGWISAAATESTPAS